MASSKVLKQAKIKRSNLQTSYDDGNDWILYCDDGTMWVTDSKGIPIKIGGSDDNFYTKSEIDNMIGQLGTLLDDINGEVV